MGESRISRRNNEVLDTRWPNVVILDIPLARPKRLVAKKLLADGAPFVVHSALAPKEVDNAFR
ncbi:hypothetical protein MesoLj113b_73060 (plasmid) [Mesorhizobium sp. 113-3-3]|nr:hypothetical protein MesoLj113b_73060 [Mesorhizobium sp. 113-3-3]